MFFFSLRLYNVSTVREAVKKWCFLGIISKPVHPPFPLGTCRNKNVTFGQKSRIFKAKNDGHQNFTLNLGIPEPSPPYLGNVPKKNNFFSAFLRLFLENYN